MQCKIQLSTEFLSNMRLQSARKLFAYSTQEVSAETYTSGSASSDITKGTDITWIGLLGNYHHRHPC